MNLSKSRKLKVNVMRALQQNEDSAVKAGILGALIEDEMTEDELPPSRDVADATRQIAASVAAALPAPAEPATETPAEPSPEASEDPQEDPPESADDGQAD